MIDDDFKIKLEQEILKHKLPPDYLLTVEQYFVPIAASICRRITAEAVHETENKAKKAEKVKQQSVSGDKQVKPYIVGIIGSQGSGKSTCADFLKLIFEQQHQLSTLVLSIDDFYLTLKKRQDLGARVHPLLATRGVPGTHDVGLLTSVLDQLSNFEQGNQVNVPRFNKASDDRHPEENWDVVHGAVDVIILEGWCVGVRPQAQGQLKAPVNELEKNEDMGSAWRSFVNQELSNSYQALFNRLDCLIGLAAPSFDCVYQWRLLQEQKMIDRLEKQGVDIRELNVLSPAQIKRFISHYQRLTEHALATLPMISDYLLTLEKDHRISGLKLSHKTKSFERQV